MKRLSLLFPPHPNPILSLLAAPPPVAIAQSQLAGDGGFDSFDGSGLATSWSAGGEVAQSRTGSLDYAGKPDWAPENNPVFTQGGQSQHIAHLRSLARGCLSSHQFAPRRSNSHLGHGSGFFANAKDFPDHLIRPMMLACKLVRTQRSTDWWTGNCAMVSGRANPHDTWQTFTLDVTAGASAK